MYKVEFACTQDGDHTASITECTSSQEKTFTSINKLLDFINQCSYVYNRNELLETIEKEVKIDKKALKENEVIIIKQEDYE
jgi:hypothetical protein